MKYDDWVRGIPSEIREDSVWQLEVYRLSLFLADHCWEDTVVIREQHHFSLADQLYRSVGSIGANITEGYSRHSFREQARFYEISLGSARESKDWYFKCRHVLGEQVTSKRIKLLTSISKLLLTMIQERKTRTLKR